MSHRLKQARQSLGLTQYQMAALMGMHQGHYSRLESGGENREPTRGHWACVRLIEHCHTAGIIDRVLASYNT